MNDRSNAVWGIVIVLALLSVLFASLKLYPVSKKWQNAVMRAQNTNIGTDKELENVIGFLEDRLKSRLDYEFSLEQEPMRLTNVVYLTDASGNQISGKRTSKIKLTSVFIGENKSAQILFKGQYFEVAVGDSVGNEIVKNIEKFGITVDKNGKEQFYGSPSRDDQLNKK